MRNSRTRLLPDGTLLQNRLLAALPAADYMRLQEHLQLNTVDVGHPLQEQGAPVTDVYFPNGGVFSVTNEMRDGALVEVATVGREGMLGIGVFLGDRFGAGRIFQQVSDGPVPSMTVARFMKETRAAGTVSRRGRVVRASQPAADHAVHGVQRSSQRDTAVLPLAAADPGSHRDRRLRVEAGIPGLHAWCPSSNRHAGDAEPPAPWSGLEQLWAHPRPETKKAGGRVVRVLRGHPGPLRASWAVTPSSGTRRMASGREGEAGPEPVDHHVFDWRREQLLDVPQQVSVRRGHQ